VWDNTLFLFCSDNGGEDRVTTNAPLRAGKSTLYEGGIRIPFVAKLPGGARAGTTVEEPVTTLDVMPEFLLRAGVKTTPELGGRPFSSAKGPRPLYWHYPLEKPHFLGGRSSGAIRRGDWKLIRFYDDGTEEMYNLRADASEKHNVIAGNPREAAQLRSLFEKWRTS